MSTDEEIREVFEQDIREKEKIVYKTEKKGGKAKENL